MRNCCCSAYFGPCYCKLAHQYNCKERSLPIHTASGLLTCDWGKCACLSHHTAFEGRIFCEAQHSIVLPAAVQVVAAVTTRLLHTHSSKDSTRQQTAAQLSLSPLCRRTTTWPAWSSNLAAQRALHAILAGALLIRLLLLLLLFGAVVA